MPLAIGPSGKVVAPFPVRSSAAVHGFSEQMYAAANA